MLQVKCTFRSALMIFTEITGLELSKIHRNNSFPDFFQMFGDVDMISSTEIHHDKLQDKFVVGSAPMIFTKITGLELN